MYDLEMKAMAGTGIERDPILSSLLARLDEEFETNWRAFLDVAEADFIDPEAMPASWLEPKADDLTAPPAYTPTIPAARKKVLAARAICRMKGTERGLRASLSLMGCTALVITDVNTAYSLDSPIELDHVTRRLDSNRCYRCYVIDIDITGPALDPDPNEAGVFLGAIGEVIIWHLPFFTRLRNVTYNGGPINPPNMKGAFTYDYATSTEFE